MIRRFIKSIIWKYRRIQEANLDIRARYPQYKIGRGTYGNAQVYSWDENTTLNIGGFCSIANGVKIFLGGEHHTNWVTTFPFGSVKWPMKITSPSFRSSKGDVTIGNDVWIGDHAVILSGVTIGDGAIIGASAVVASDVPPYTIYAGNPAREIRRRFDDDTIRRLLNLRWWEWPDEKIQRYIPLMMSHKVQDFLDKTEKEQA